MKKIVFCLVLVCSLFLYFGCSNDDNPVPVLSSLSPSVIAAHMPELTLVLTGSKFVNNATVSFGGTVKSATFVSSSELHCQITPSDIASIAGENTEGEGSVSLQNSNIIVYVINPSPGGGNSNSLTFSVHSNHDFITPTNISNDNDSARRTRIGMDSQNNISVVWDDESNNGVIDVVYTRSTDHGATWSQKVGVSNSGFESVYPDLAIGTSADINVVWEEHLGGNSEIYFSRSVDNGVSWSNPVNISKTSDNSTLPAVTVDKLGHIYVAWVESIYFRTKAGYSSFIYFSHSTDGGISWIQPLELTETVCEKGPAIATDPSNNIFVAFRVGKCAAEGDVVVMNSGDGGYSWLPQQYVSTGDGDADHPALGVDSSGNLNLVWQQITSGNYDIYHARSTDTNTTWSQPVNISQNTGSSENPSIAIDSLGNLNVSWDDNTLGAREIFQSRSVNNGATWSAYSNISNNAGESKGSDTAVDSGCNLYMVWLDNTIGNIEIYFIRSVIASLTGR